MQYYHSVCCAIGLENYDQHQKKTGEGRRPHFALWIRRLILMVSETRWWRDQHVCRGGILSVKIQITRYDTLLDTHISSIVCRCQG